MKRPFLFLLAAVLCLSVQSQIHLKGYNQKLINPELFSKPWTAYWITAPEGDIAAYGVYHFRRTLQLAAVPERFVVHVSADNRYKLFVNGRLVSLGPARCDVKNWNFETVDLAPYLKAGKNVLAALVWYAADEAPVAQMSTGRMLFLMQGNTKAERSVDTGKAWKVVRDKAYQPFRQWTVRGYYACGACDKVDGHRYPWGWETADYDDSGWQAARIVLPASLKGGVNIYSPPLVPSPLPQMEHHKERLKTVRKVEGNVSVPQDFLGKPTVLSVPANTKVRLLLDNKVLTAGYPTLIYSRGRDAEIKIGYAEALFTKPQASSRDKGNRNEVEGKYFDGYADLVVSDGGQHRTFTPLWWRTWRYIELQITTKEEPLEINDLYGTSDGYPFKMASRFSAPERPVLDSLIEVGWRTARLCCHETYMDCPYYEQLMYFGDTRIQTMLTMYNTRDSFAVRNALEMGRQSLNNEGITLSRYPDNIGQLIPNYAFSWIGMCYDYWMLRGDESYLKTLLPALRSILGWYEQFLKSDGSLDKIPYWYFTDWSAGLNAGMLPREEHGNSAFQDLEFILALDEAASMERKFGIAGMAEHYEQTAQRVRRGFNDKYWDASKQVFADTHDHRSFSQHVNILAILAGMVEGDSAKNLCRRILNDRSLTQATIFYQYYLHMAMDKAGLADELLDHIETYTGLFKLGLTTCMEAPEPNRSDCHAWSACMNIELLRMVLGVHSDAPAFGKVLITPAPGRLKEVSGSVPCPQGDIEVAYRKGRRFEATVTLPAGLDGRLVYNGKTYPLKSGTQKLRIE